MVQFLRYGRTNSSLPASENNAENSLMEMVRFGETQKIHQMSKDPAQAVLLSQNWDLVRKCAKELLCDSTNQDERHELVR